MEKIYESNGNILYLYNILKYYSDINHPLSKNDIIDLISDIYDVDISDRTIRRDIKVLESKFGLTISSIDNKYYLEPSSNDLEKSEVRLLIDLVNYSRFLSINNSKVLSNKLISLLNIYDRNSFNKYNLYLKNNKNDNKQLFYTIDIISDAINLKKVIEVDYYKYNINKELIFVRSIKISPYLIILNNSEYYLIGYHNYNKIVTYFRIDRIKNTKIVSDKYIKVKDDLIKDRINNSVDSFIGVPDDIDCIVNYDLLDDVIERFGKNIILTKYNNYYFRMKLRIGVDGFKYWVLRNINNVKIISPSYLVDDIKNILKSSLEWYNE